ncbi:MAG TPA: glycosyltransferase family 39 protein [Acidimicrobiales bacterium]|nr:glycosyltransferase family 39 protein [Acidimicrobiales bacterium]
MAVVDRPEQVEAPPRPWPSAGEGLDPLAADVDPLDQEDEEGRSFDPTPVTSRPRVLSARDPVVRDLLALGGVLAALAFLWGRQRGIVYWHDEGISIGIASHRLDEIPRLLRQDGSPPLYYAILHFWMRAFGSAEAATHLLSLLFSLGTVVAAWWAGRSLFGRRVGWFLTVLAAINPFLAFYANETRMYSMVVFLTTLFTASFLHAFVYRRRRYLVLFAVTLALLLYTHNWALFLAFAAVAAVGVCAVFAADRRRLLTDAALCFAAAGAVYVPWLPSLLYQRAHTGAPWAPRPTLLEARDNLAGLLGGFEVVAAVLLAGGAALVALVRQVRTRTAVSLMVLAVLPLVGLGTAWGISRGSSVWAFRYLGIALPAVLLVAAVALAAGGRMAVAAIAVAAVLSAPIAVKTPPERKSNIRTTTARVAPYLRGGDLVISGDDGAVPLLSHYLPPGLRYATTEGLVANERVSDQREYVNRLRNSRWQTAIPALVDEMPVGGRILLIAPNYQQTRHDWVEFLRLLLQRTGEVKAMLLQDQRLRLELASTDATEADVVGTRVDAFVFTKQAPAGRA